MTNKTMKKSGFTLIELLIVIAVIGIIAAIAFVSLNPLGRFQDSRNAKRWSDVTMLMDAIKLNQVDNGGSYFGDIADLTTGLYYQIGNGDTCNQTCSYPTIVLQEECLDLEGLTDEGTLPTVPVDPNDSGSDEGKTGYYLVKNANGSITIGACHEEPGTSGTPPQIQLTR